MLFTASRNLTALYFVKIAKWMNLVMPIIVLFYKANGLSMREVFTLQAVYSVTIMVLEIPTGYFADILGRKRSILIGACMGFGGYLIYSFSYGFWQFAVAETILGISASLVSGADSAMLYDTLVASNRSEEYTRFEGRVSSIGNFAEALAGIIGGLIAVISLRTPYFVQTIVSLIAIPAALFLQEPPVKLAPRKPGVKDVIRIVLKAIHGDVKLKWNIIFSSVTGASTLTMAWFAQPYFSKIHLQIEGFGFVWAALNLIVGFAAFYAWRVEKRFGPEKTTLFFTLALIASYLLLSFVDSFYGLIILAAFYIARGIATPTLRDYINRISVSEERATVLSVRNFVIRLIFATLGPLYGWCTDQYGLSRALFIAGIVFGLLSAISLFFFLKYKTYSA